MSGHTALVITVLAEGKPPANHRYERPRVTIGRAATNDLVLAPDSAVSAEHARFERHDGAWRIVDCQSKNGLYREGPAGLVRLAGPEPVESGTTYLLGTTRLQVAFEPVSARRRRAEASTRPDSRRPDTGGTSAPCLTLTIDRHGEDLVYQFHAEGALARRYTRRCAQSDMEELANSVLALLDAARYDNPETAETHRGRLDESGATAAARLLPAQVRAQLDAAPPSGLFLSLHPSLLTMPWELVPVAGEPLGLRHAVGRQVLADNVSRVEPASQPGSTLLFLCNPTGDRVPQQTHAQALMEQITAAAPQLNIDFLAGPRVTRTEALQRLPQAGMVYYVGHAEFDESDPANSGWRLAKGRITCQDFRALPQAPAFVFANACQSGREGEWSITGRRLRTSGYGLASAFMLAGVNHYLGTVCDLPGPASDVFSQAVFDALLAGEPVGACVRAGRLALRTAGYSTLWAAHVLYGHPNKQVFPQFAPEPV